MNRPFVSAQGRSRKLARLNGMSVLPSTADVVGPPRHVRFVPVSDSCSAASSLTIRSPRRRVRGVLPGFQDQVPVLRLITSSNLYQRPETVTHKGFPNQ